MSGCADRDALLLGLTRGYITSFTAVCIQIFWQSAASEAGWIQSPVWRILLEQRQPIHSFYVTRLEHVDSIDRECQNVLANVRWMVGVGSARDGGYSARGLAIDSCGPKTRAISKGDAADVTSDAVWRHTE